MPNISSEVYYDFFASPKSQEWFRRTVPAVMELFDYDRSLYDDKQLRATILAEITHYLPISSFQSLAVLLYEDKKTAMFVRDQIKLRTDWWFKNYVSYDEYMSGCDKCRCQHDRFTLNRKR